MDMFQGRTNILASGAITQASITAAAASSAGVAMRICIHRRGPRGRKRTKLAGGRRKPMTEHKNHPSGAPRGAGTGMGNEPRLAFCLGGQITRR